MTRKEKHEKLDTVVELRKVGDKVAEWAKSEFPMSVEDTEVLAYFEDGVGNVGIRLYGKLMREHFKDVAKKMKAEGLNDCEARLSLQVVIKPLSAGSRCGKNIGKGLYRNEACLFLYVNTLYIIQFEVAHSVT